MKLNCELIVEVDGRRVYGGPARSFLKNLSTVLAGLLKSSGTGSVKYVLVTDPTGSSVKAAIDDAYPGGREYDYGPITFNAGDNDDTYGIWVGSGSTPVSPSDYALASKIPHGTGAGQLDYDTHMVVSSYSPTSSYVEIYRSFVNKSGSDVVVREVGLAAHSRDGYQGIDSKFLVARDVLPSPITVKPLGSLTVRYRISLSM
jgi:hypothetical protein